MPKKKVIAVPNLKRLDQVYHSKQGGKVKKKIKFLIAAILCFPE
jgi:hypothetical protein